MRTITSDIAREIALLLRQLVDTRTIFTLLVCNRHGLEILLERINCGDCRSAPELHEKATTLAQRAINTGLPTSSANVSQSLRPEPGALPLLNPDGDIVGAVVFLGGPDFPGEELIRKVIDRNFAGTLSVAPKP